MTIKDILKKIKSFKHLHIVFAVLIGLVLCAICYAFVGASTTDDKTEQNETESVSTAEEYVAFLENKLENVLSKISGAGDVNVIITLSGGFTYVYATDSETKTTISGGAETTITTETIIYVSGEPVVEQQIYPEIKGVVIVASGAADFSVKMNLISAAETVLEIDSDKIIVLS